MEVRLCEMTYSQVKEVELAGEAQIAILSSEAQEIRSALLEASAELESSREAIGMMRPSLYSIGFMCTTQGYSTT